MDGTGCVTARGEVEAPKGEGHNSVQSTLVGLAYPMAPWAVGTIGERTPRTGCPAIAAYFPQR